MRRRHGCAAIRTISAKYRGPYGAARCPNVDSSHAVLGERGKTAGRCDRRDGDNVGVVIIRWVACGDIIIATAVACCLYEENIRSVRALDCITEWLLDVVLEGLYV